MAPSIPTADTLATTIDFDPGYGQEPWRTLCRTYPGEDVYPAAEFRTEWGPIFHRGRLDGTARVLVIGQDPAAHEAIARRILIGEAGQRTQGFLAKLGISQSYVMVNTYLYSVYGQTAGDKHKADPTIAAYRNQWLDAIASHNTLEAIIALGTLADSAYQSWITTSAAAGIAGVPYAHITHPTEPEGAGGGDPAKIATLMAAMLQNWNAGLKKLYPLPHPDAPVLLAGYDTTLPPTDVPIPSADLPAGLPAWMQSLESWASRTGATADDKRATITVAVPSDARAWQHP